MGSGMSHTLPAGHSLRHPTMDDVGAAVAVIVAADLAESGEIHTDERELRQEWARSDLASDAWLVVDPTGQIIAYAILFSRAGVLSTCTRTIMSAASAAPSPVRSRRAPQRW